MSLKGSFVSIPAAKTQQDKYGRGLHQRLTEVKVDATNCRPELANANHGPSEGPLAVKSKREQALELLLRYHDKTKVSQLRKKRHTFLFHAERCQTSIRGWPKGP